ncbi:hypothetical protein [Micromonospora fulviviridis]|uniref:Uncharacterized protein n=1 Tax=Micromonospora fulviviridis TaxID=47860 RepID=A0ABV2VW62_9ACTN
MTRFTPTSVTWARPRTGRGGETGERDLSRLLQVCAADAGGGVYRWPSVTTMTKQASAAIAATFIGVLVTWDLVGHLPVALGVAGHEGSTVIVDINCLRLLRQSAWRRTT